ncbi:hypothetical protein AB0M28_19635 [Streptomyces sp. NPDC051940]|uniref:hypothetical protein n=1 Tax=Streptomyces sp. NPDC051940 TaxID=3155675 RepID=UPI003444AC8F
MTRRRVRTTPLALTLAAAAALTVSLTGCDSVDKALDCGRLAANIADDVQDLQNTASNAGDSPQAFVDALDAINTDLKDWKGQTDNADLTQAVDDLQKAVDSARQSAEDGTVPDVTPIADAAGEVSKVCTS